MYTADGQLYFGRAAAEPLGCHGPQDAGGAALAGLSFVPPSFEPGAPT
jgi:hypothetical protein